MFCSLIVDNFHILDTLPGDYWRCTDWPSIHKNKQINKNIFEKCEKKQLSSIMNAMENWGQLTEVSLMPASCW